MDDDSLQPSALSVDDAVMSRPKGACCAGNDWKVLQSTSTKSVAARGGNAGRPKHVLCAVALTPGMLIVVARIVVDSVTLATCLVFGLTEELG